MELDHQAGPIGLASLPDELISLILRNFCLHCRQGTRDTPHAYFPATGQKREERSWYAVDVSALHAMCLVSRRFLPLAQEILYHEFAWAYGDSSASLMDDWSHRLTAFLRTVARNKDLAALVKRVYICLTHFFIIPETEADSVLEDAAQARGIRLANFLGSFGDVKDPDLPLREPALLAMLLACLPRLKTLSVLAGVRLTAIPAASLRAAGISSLPLETLDIACCDIHTGSHNGILDLASFTIRSLFLNMCDDDMLSELSKYAFPNLRNLCIAQSSVSHSGLEPFLSRCVGLEIFSCESDNEFLSSDIVAYLFRNKNTLHTLHLKYDVDSQTQDGSARSVADLESSLNTFPALRNLFLTTTLLYQMMDGSAENDGILTRLLPPSLASLQLAVVDDNPWLNLRLEIGVMADLARAVSQGHFPHLRCVSCIPTTKGRLDMHRLEAMFACAGVKFGYDGWQFHDGVAGERVYSLGPSPAYSTAITVGSDDESLQSW
ncbi:hypothetical protein VTG60DRAFT_6142 [Thermothelomyces hinnuleus]